MSILRNKNKLISLILALSLIMGILPSMSYAEDTDDTYPSFELLGYLKIDEGINEDNTSSISRAEFTAMAVRSINPQLSPLYDGSFVDVADGDMFSKEIYIAKSLRMTSGTSEGVFSPDSPIDMSAAQKMLVTALGFENWAVSLGGWPTGYSVLASRLGILKGISNSGALTVGDAKLMILNALKTDKAVISGITDGNIDFTTTAGVNLLTDNFNLKLVSGIVDKASYMSKSTAFNYSDSIKVGSLELATEFDTAKYFGKRVNAWYDSGKKILKAIETDSVNNEVIIPASELSSYSSFKLNTYTEQGKEKSYTMESNFTFIENGRPVIYTNNSFIFDNGSLRLIDNDGDGKFEFVIAQKIEYFVVRSKSDTTETVYDNKSEIKNICFDNDDICCLVTDIDGNISDYDGITLGAVLEVLKSADGKVCVAKITNSTVASGVVDEVQQISFTHDNSTYSATDIIFIGGVAYETTDYFKINHKTADTGKSYDLLLSSEGRVVSLVGALSSDLKYGYFLGYDEGQGMSANTKVKLLTVGNTREVYSLADYVTLDGQRVKKTHSDIKAKLTNGVYPAYQVIRYNLNSEGQLSVIDTSVPVADYEKIPEITDTNNTLTQYLDGITMQFRNGHSFGAPYFSFKSAYLFSLPTGLADNPDAYYNDEEFYVTSVEGWSGYAQSGTKFDVYDMSELYIPALITGYMSVGASDSPEVGSTTSSKLVYKITSASDEDGADTLAVYTLGGGRYDKYLINADSLATLRAQSLIPKAGDVVRLKLDIKNKIIGAAIDVSCDQNGKPVPATVAGPASTSGYMAGKVVVAEGRNIVLKADTFPSGFTDTSITSGIAPLELNNSATCTFYNTKTGEAKAGNIEDIKSVKTVGEGYEDYVAVRLSYYLGQGIFVYTK